MTMLFVVDDETIEGDTYAVLTVNNELRPISAESFEMLLGWGYPVAADGEPQNPIAVIGTCQFALGADVVGVGDPGVITLDPTGDEEQWVEKFRKAWREWSANPT